MIALLSVLKEDILWAETGDFKIAGGDIVDSRSVKGSGFIDEIICRLRSASGDWKIRPMYGADLQDFEGETNDQRTWGNVQARISEVLTDELLSSGDFSINIIPLGDDEIAVRIDFSQGVKQELGTELPPIKMVYNMITNNSFITR